MTDFPVWQEKLAKQLAHEILNDRAMRVSPLLHQTVERNSGDIEDTTRAIVEIWRRAGMLPQNQREVMRN